MYLIELKIFCINPLTKNVRSVIIIIKQDGDKMEKIIKKGIIAIVPVYLPGRGNCTTIYTKDNEHINIYKTIKTVIRNICEYYHLDMKAAKKTYGELLSIRNFPPIPFTPDDIFIYVKMRKPICEYDGAYGYIKIDAIHKIIDSNGKTLIHLTSGDIIEGLANISTVKRNIKNGEIVKKLYDRKGKRLEEDNLDFYSQEDKAATKGDIAMLYMKMMEIKESMES